MKNNVKRNRRPGFTLVELLIVIIIIGILAGGMMMVAGAGTDKANATKIVSDLRNLKSAALMYYADNNDWPANGEAKTVLDSYIDREIDSGYKIGGVSGDYIGYEGGLMSPGVIDKLIGMAVTSGLLGSANGTTPDSTTDVFVSGDKAVWMIVH